MSVARIARVARRVRASVSRNPVLAAAVLAAVALLAFLLVKLVKRRENWQFAVPGQNITADDKHGKFIIDRCAKGLTWGYITNNDDWKYLSKYNGDQAWALCKQGQAKGFFSGKYTEADAKKECKARGREVCPVKEMIGQRPCMNKDRSKGDRCCDVNGKNCVSRWGRWGPKPAASGRGNKLDGSKVDSGGGGGGGGWKEPDPKQEPGKPSWKGDRDWGPDVKLFGTDDATDPSGGWIIPAPKRGEEGGLRTRQGWNDKVRAVYVPKGLKVTLYEKVGWQGKEVPLTRAGLHSLAGDTIYRNASSIKVTWW